DGIFYNPAGLSLAGNQYGGTYTQLFGNSFTGLTTIGGTYATNKLGTLAFAYQDMSVEFEDVNLMSERTYALGHSICLNKDVNSEIYFGYSANIYNLSFDELGSQTSVGFNAGAIAILHTRTKLGFNVTNFNNPRIGDENEHELPQRLAAGIAYIPYQGVTTAFDIKKTWNGDSEYHAGVEVEVHPMLLIRTGVRNNPAAYSFGAGIRPYKGLAVDYAVNTHSVLNPTHHFGLSLKF
ncbi:MAG TPA: hypothetical protein PKJ08_13665, partial [Candidatus Cloacimonadota bacterium]|nr:hypothetical protein [Candidatus Cloacimonadota bacterium]